MPRRAAQAAVIAALALAALAALGTASTRPAPRDGAVAGAARSAVPKETFAISGRVMRPLRPGASGALNLRLANRHRYDLLVTRLYVSLRVDRAHVAAGCDRYANFRIRRLRAGQYPIRLRARRTRSLQALGVAPLPRVSMRMLATNQDACKNARLALRFSGLARRAPNGRSR